MINILIVWVEMYRWLKENILTFVYGFGFKFKINDY